MINRYTLVNTNYLTNSFDLDMNQLNPIYNAFPTKRLPIITLNNHKKISFEYWGSNINFSKDNVLPDRLVNISLTKIEKSNIYINQFKSERCLIPCDGFYLWKNYKSKEKIPYYFNYKKNKIIYCVGVRDSFEDFNGQKFTFFYFITGSSYDKFKDYTSNVPVVFDMKYFDIWSDKKSNFKKLTPFMNRIKLDDLEGYIVSPYFQDKKKDDSSLIKSIQSLNQYGNYSLFD